MQQQQRQQKIAPCLWFDGRAEEAARFYVAAFPNSRIKDVLRYGDAGPGPKGTVLAVDFELDGQAFQALNGGPQFSFSPAISFSIDCGAQEEVDGYWNKLLEGGGAPQQCGWLTDRFGVSWQVVPRALGEMLKDPDAGKAQRVMQAMLGMVKLDIAGLKRAYEAAP